MSCARAARNDGTELNNRMLPPDLTLDALCVTSGDSFDLVANVELFACLSVMAKELRFAAERFGNTPATSTCPCCGQGMQPAEEWRGRKAWPFCADPTCGKWEFGVGAAGCRRGAVAAPANCTALLPGGLYAMGLKLNASELSPPPPIGLGLAFPPPPAPDGGLAPPPPAGAPAASADGVITSATGLQLEIIVIAFACGLGLVVVMLGCGCYCFWP